MVFAAKKSELLSEKLMQDTEVALTDHNKVLFRLQENKLDIYLYLILSALTFASDQASGHLDDFKQAVWRDFMDSVWVFLFVCLNPGYHSP